MHFWRFVDHSAELGPELHHSHNLSLVVISFLVAWNAGYTALEIADRRGAAKSRRGRFGWLVLGAGSMGVGIWAMHFVGMLAMALPVEVSYDLLTTALSVVPAVLAGAVAIIF